MKLIKSSLNQDKVLNDLNIVIDNSSHYVLIEKGKETIADCINIVYEQYDPKKILDLMKESGYFKTNSNHLIGKTNNEMQVIPLKDIVYIEGINNDTYLHTKNQEFSTKLKLYELEGILINKLFIRISKSYIVSVSHIEKIKPTFNGKLLLLMDDGSQLEVSRHYISDFRKVLGM